MRNKENGATMIEFSLVLIMFLMFTLSLLDFSRLLYTWNAANEATRIGARYAVVCDDTSKQAAVLAKMKGLVPEISTIQTQWTPNGCNASSCEGVTVWIEGLNFNFIAPIPGDLSQRIVNMPRFSTYLPREMMRQDPFSNAFFC